MRAMKRIFATLGLLACGIASADAPMYIAPAPSEGALQRYIIERRFAPGALDQLGRKGTEMISKVDGRLGVRLVMTYANASKTKAYCIYEGPNAAAVRETAIANGIPLNAITEIPVTVLPTISVVP